MIELIFVIVIMGILAMVALPRFAGVQDDAMIANEDAGIDSIRTAVVSIRGKALTAGIRRDINITTFGNDGNEYYATIYSLGLIPSGGGINAGEQNRSETGYPVGISTDALTGALQTTARVQGTGDGVLALALEPDGRDQWQTLAGDIFPSSMSVNTATTVIKGPASLGVVDDNAKIHSGMCWGYNPVPGTIQLSPPSVNGGAVLVPNVGDCN
jgi:type II secretory pathway pseudopilin PulG